MKYEENQTNAVSPKPREDGFTSFSGRIDIRLMASWSGHLYQVLQRKKFKNEYGSMTICFGKILSLVILKRTIILKL